MAKLKAGTRVELDFDAMTAGSQLYYANLRGCTGKVVASKGTRLQVDFGNGMLLWLHGSVVKQATQAGLYD